MYTPIEALIDADGRRGDDIRPHLRDDGRHAPSVRRLYDRAKRLGVWDPASIDFSCDARDWHRLTHDERDLLMHASCRFLDGEDAVVRDLLPAAQVVVAEARLDDVLFVTAWLWEEGKHAEFFRRFESAVLAGEDLAPYRSVGQHPILDDALPASMAQLRVDSSTRAQTRAFVTYCLIVEGVMGEMGHRVFRETLDTRGLLPGLRRGLALVRRDESRHVAFGMLTLSRLLRADPANRRTARETVRELEPLLEELASRGEYPDAPAGVRNRLDQPRERLYRRLAWIERRNTALSM